MPLPLLVPPPPPAWCGSVEPNDPLAAGAILAIETLGSPFVWWRPGAPLGRFEAVGILRLPDRSTRFGTPGMQVQQVSLRVPASHGLAKDDRLTVNGRDYKVSKAETEPAGLTVTLFLQDVSP